MPTCNFCPDTRAVAVMVTRSDTYDICTSCALDTLEEDVHGVEAPPPVLDALIFEVARRDHVAVTGRVVEVL